MSFGAIADAANATSRLFEAELLDDTHVQDRTLEFAIAVKGAPFTWNSLPPDVMSSKKANPVQEGWQSEGSEGKKPEAENTEKDDRESCSVQGARCSFICAERSARGNRGCRRVRKDISLAGNYTGDEENGGRRQVRR